MVTNADLHIICVNSAFSRITGYAEHEVIGHKPHVLSSNLQKVSFYEAMWCSIKSNGSWQGEIWNQRKSGELYLEYLTITVVNDQYDEISNYVGTFLDVTLTKEAVDKIERLAHYDSLTELPNRLLLQDRLKLALAVSQRNDRLGALILIDMDNFKILNDTLGHDRGDLLLQQVAQRLLLCVRETDTVARIGGDEFVIMLEGLCDHVTEAAAFVESMANKVLAVLSQYYQLSVHDYYCTSSMGVTLFKGHE